MRVEPLDVEVVRFHRGVSVELPEAHAAAKGRRATPKLCVQPSGLRCLVFACQHVALHPRDLDVLRESVICVAVLVHLDKREPLVVVIPSRLVVREGEACAKCQARERRNGQVWWWAADVVRVLRQREN